MANVFIFRQTSQKLSSIISTAVRDDWQPYNRMCYGFQHGVVQWAYEPVREQGCCIEAVM